MGSERVILRIPAAALVALSLGFATLYGQDVRINVQGGNGVIIVGDVKVDAGGAAVKVRPVEDDPKPKNAGQQADDEPEGTTRSVFFDENPDVSARLRKAAELMGEKHYEAAFNLYLWVLENAPDGVFRLDENRYLSVRDHCIAGVASLPEEFRRQYRIQTDGEVIRLYETALRRMDAAELDRLGRRYYLSSYGPEMLDAAGDVYAGRGEIGRAVACWRTLLGWGLLGDEVKSGMVRAKLVLALARMGRADEARQQVVLLRRSAPQAPVVFGGEKQALVEFLSKSVPMQEEAPVEMSEVSRDHWPQFGGGPGHSETMPASFKCDVKTGEASVRVSFGASQNIQVVRFAQGEQVRETLQRVPFYLVSSGGRVFVHGTGGIRALRLRDGREDWFYGEFNAPPTNSGRRQVTPFGMGASLTNLAYACAVGDGMVFCSLPSGPKGREIWGLSESGRLLWRMTSESEGYGWLGETDAVGDPVFWKGRLYLSSFNGDAWRTEVFLTCADAATGECLWRRFLCSGANMSRVNSIQMQADTLNLPAAAEELVVVCTDAGGIVAVEARTGEVRWGYAYERNMVNPWTRARMVAGGGDEPAAPCRNSTPVIRDGRVFVMPEDSDYLYVLDLQSGRRLWTAARGESVQIVGVVDDRLILSGRTVIALNVADGSVVWRSAAGDIGFAGQGFITEDAVYVPGKGAIYRFDPESGRLLGRLLAREDADEFGNLLLVGQTMVQVGTKIHYYGEWDQVFAELNRLARLDAKDPDPQYRLGEIYARKEARREAIACYEKALALASAPTPRGVKGGAQIGEDARARLFVLYALEAEKSMHAGDENAALQMALRRRQHARDDGERIVATRGILDIYRRRGDWTLLVAELQALLERPPRGVFPFEGDVLVASEIYARLSIDRIIAERGAGVYAAFERKAGALLATGQRSDLEKVVAFYPNSEAAGGALTRLADMSGEAGQPDQAAAHLEHYLRLGKGDASRRMQVRWKLANYYERDRRFGAAARLLGSLAEEYPNAVIKEAGGDRRLADVVADRLKRPEFAGALHADRDIRFTVPLTTTIRLKTGANPRLVPHNEPGEALLVVDAERNFRCVDAQTGKEEWAAKLANPYAMNAHIEGDRLVVCERTLVRAFNRTSGEQLWVYNVPPLVQKLANGREAGFPQTAQFLGGNDRIAAVCMTGRTREVHVLDATSGVLLWKQDLSVFPVGAPVVLRDRMVLPLQNGVIAFHLEEGRKIFEVQLNGNVYGYHRLGDNRLLMKSHIELACIDAESGKVAWRVKQATGQPLNPTDVVRDGRAERMVGVTSDGGLTCLDAATGERVWSSKPAGGNIRPTRMEVRNDAVYLLQMVPKPAGQPCWRVLCLSLTDGSQTWLSAEMPDFDVRDWSVGRQAIALAGNERKIDVQNGRIVRQTFGGAKIVCLDVRSGRIIQTDSIEDVAPRNNMYIQVNLLGVGEKLWAAFPSAVIALEGKRAVERVPDVK